LTRPSNGGQARIHSASSGRVGTKKNQMQTHGPVWIDADSRGLRDSNKTQFVIPSAAFVIPSAACVIPSAAFVIPSAPFVIPSAVEESIRIARPLSFRAQPLSFRAQSLSFRAHPLSFRAQSRNLFKYPSEAAPHFEGTFCYSLLVNSDDDKLNPIGWPGNQTPTALTPPGQTRQLEAPKQGEGWVFLDWKQSLDAGRIIAYKIQRRNRTDGAWQDGATAIETEATLVDSCFVAYYAE